MEGTVVVCPQVGHFTDNLGLIDTALWDANFSLVLIQILLSEVAEESVVEKLKVAEYEGEKQVVLEEMDSVLSSKGILTNI